ncbi:30S ribosomal protein S2, partial [Treponema pallidum]
VSLHEEGREITDYENYTPPEEREYSVNDEGDVFDEDESLYEGR